MSTPVSLVEALLRRAGTTPDEPAFRTLPAGGAVRDDTWTWRRWADASRAVAGALAERFDGGTRVGILAGNRPIWPVADLGIQWAGMISVGLYPTSAPVQVGEVLGDCQARVALVDGQEQYDKLVAALPSLPELEMVVHADEVATTPLTGVTQSQWTELLRQGEAAARTTPPAPPDPASDAVLIYTSGSTGAPKGARITHATLVASARSIQETLRLVAGDRTLSFLPYCHAAERIFGLATRLVVGIEVGLVPDPGRVFEAARAYRPTVFGGLPRFFEKIYEAALDDPSAGTAVIHRFLGDAVRVATSGGAALPVEVSRTLDGLGLTVLGAYGLTEHLCATFNRADDPHFATSGLPMPGTELRIADDGEILLRRSGLTFQGYWGRPEATAEAFTPDGAWLRTGDLGQVDDGGHLRVTGRKKDLIALSTGKKVAPARLEGWLVEQPWIEHAVLFGEGRKYVSALLTLRRPLVEAWARDAGIDLAWPELVRDERVLDHLGTQVGRVNERVSRTESVRRFEVLPEPLSVASGDLTPTLKVRRDVVAEHHADAVAALYAEAVR